MEINSNGVVFSGRMGIVENTLKDIEAYMGGPVELVKLTNNILLIRKQEKNGKKLPVNRALIKDGKVVEILTGNLICVRQGKMGFCSIERADVEEIRKYLKPVFHLDGQLFI